MFERRTRGLMLGLVLVLTSACGQHVVGEAVAADNPVSTSTRTAKVPTSRSGRPLLPSATTSSSRAAAPGGLAALTGTWEGEYTCSQGITGLRLTVGSLDGGSLPTVFAFFPLPANPNAKTGSYSMLGGLGAGEQLVFRQQQWIEQPSGYTMVDLAVTSPIEGAVTQLSGDVLTPTCKGFSVRRR